MFKKRASNLMAVFKPSSWACGIRFCSAPLVRGAKSAGRAISSCSFITLHHAYFVLTCLIFSGIFYAISKPVGRVTYVDSLFLVVSAMTLTGLNTVNLSTVNTAQQIILFCLIIFGSAIFVSVLVVHVRKNAFEHRFTHIAELRRKKAERRGPSMRSRLSSFSRTNTRDITDPRGIVPAQAVSKDEPSEKQAPHGQDQQSGGQGPSVADRLRKTDSGSTPANAENSHGGQLDRTQTANTDNNNVPHVTFDAPLHRPKHPPLIPVHGIGAHRSATIRKRPTSQPLPGTPVGAEPEAFLNTVPDRSNFFSSHTISRNSQFHHLSEKERRQLGGYEYEAIQLLSWLVPTYFILFQFLGCLGLGAYVAYNRAAVARQNGLNPWWVGSFNAVSAFNNSGMSLLDANMVAFQTSIYMLITMGLLILAGNTCYPIFLRLIIWTFLKLLPRGEEWDNLRRTLQFLLNHPRRCYTNMFPSQHTWWLLFAVIILNSVDWAAFELLNIGNHAIEAIPVRFRVLDGLFQAFAVRSGGFYVVPISSVRISLQVLYVIMMYISVYPVVITLRNTNVYEERSLGIYADDPRYQAQQAAPKQGFFGRLLATRPFDDTTQYFVRHQLRAQLSHDIWGIVLAIFVITCIEAHSFERDPAVFSVFNIIFETVSAYGCVGISVGLPNEAYSFCGAWHACSKLVLCAVMLRGRHRGLPVAIDKAVLLPREEQNDAEEDDELIRMERSVSRGRSV